ncbi:FAD-dependent oxidoreductase [Pseudonocardia sp. NPDC046786]|uniref:FAD-dependent oxidoreductase n=1 Tax=Pseudonocardia sp. NPDC046786 TaxID=3155471 RepID=UPI00340FE867
MPAQPGRVFTPGTCGALRRPPPGRCGRHAVQGEAGGVPDRARADDAAGTDTAGPVRAPIDLPPAPWPAWPSTWLARWASASTWRRWRRAGVIGSAIALELARAGRRVTVVDRAGGPGEGSTSLQRDRAPQLLHPGRGRDGAPGRRTFAEQVLDDVVPHPASDRDRRRPDPRLGPADCDEPSRHPGSRPGSAARAAQSRRERCIAVRPGR